MARTPLTGTEILTFITTALRAAFTTQQIPNIYKDPQNQNFSTPCIVVTYINQGHESRLKQRALKSYIVDVRVHPVPNKDGLNTWFNGLLDKIIDVLRYVDVDGDIVKPGHIEAQVTDSVLHVIANYSFEVVYVEDEQPDMQTLTINTERVN